MIQLYGYIPAFGRPDISPFCSKVHAYLNYRRLPFKAQTVLPSKSPSGKLPCIVTESGAVIPDSSRILLTLEQTNPKPLDANLTPEQKARSRALQSMLEEDLYFVMAWLMWCDEGGWQHYRTAIANYAHAVGVPKWACGAVAELMRREVRKALTMQGVGRRSPQEIEARGIELLQALQHHLDQHPFVLGDELHLIDFTAHVFIKGSMRPPFDHAVARYARLQPRLVDYVARMDVLTQAEPAPTLVKSPDKF